MPRISDVKTIDARFPLEDGAGSDAIHTDPQYGYAVTCLTTEDGQTGTGLTYTLGGGTNLICEAIKLLVEPILGLDIESAMAQFGKLQKSIAEHHQIRWLGPHKGVIHSALSSITNACFDLWAKSRNQPLWQLLLDLDPESVVNLLDLSYLDEVLPRSKAIEILEEKHASRDSREFILETGYPGYDTSVGWFRYSDERILENASTAVDKGFRAMKLKVGGPRISDDVRRACLIREAVGDDVDIMLDANQAWSLPQALDACEGLATMNPFWIEEPTQPDDVLAHRKLAEAIAPTPIAVGECVANRVIWKNFLQSGAVGIVQADCTRLAGVSEYLAVSLMATQFPVRVVPHVGDMGQIHQHLVLFNHIALGHEVCFLEHIPHLQKYFRIPAHVENGVYRTPSEPGASTELNLKLLEPSS
ncbi:MAG: enolase C-terminal domain-like protein [Pirellulales bacterium]